MSRLNKLTRQMSRTVTLAAEAAQLAVLQRVIVTSRMVRRGQLWIKPIQRWLWLMPISYVAGLLGTYLLLAH